jgi:hypothetical protein
MEESDMGRSFELAALVAALVIAGGAAFAQGMLLDYAADRVIKKYTTETCEQIKAERDQPLSEKDKLAIDFLHADEQARKFFIDKVAAPVANKMFECGLFP